MSKTLVKSEFISVTNPLRVWFVEGLERQSLTLFVDSNVDVHNYFFYILILHQGYRKNLKSSLPIWDNAKQLEYIFFPMINLKGLVMFSTCHLSNAL